GSVGSTVNEVEFQKKGTIISSGAGLPRPYFGTAIFLDNGDIYGDNSFMTLDLAGGKSYRFDDGKTQTIVSGGTLNASGSGCSDNITLISRSAGAQAFVNTSGANFPLQYVTVMDIAVTGGGSITAGNSIDLGNNTGWTITAPMSRDLYWVGGGGNWNDILHWSLSSGGGGGACIPSAFDNVFFDQNSGFGSGQSVTVNDAIGYCHDMMWSNVANSPEFKVSSSSNKLYVYGSLALEPGMTLNFNGEMRFRSTSSGETILTGGNTFTKNIYLEGAGGGWTFSDDFTSDGDIRQSAGTLRTDNHTLMVDDIIAGGSSIYLGSSDVHVAVNFSVGSGTILDAGTSHLYMGSGGHLNASVSHTLYNVTIAGSGGLVSDCNIDQKLTFLGAGTYEGSVGSTVNEVEFQKKGTIISSGAGL
ncbi:MAG: hypothetical protein KDC70_19435, partial [Saprospiraceae bacterium]|nr:hypothetical protein [Saprospiraceae bacterium]